MISTEKRPLRSPAVREAGEQLARCFNLKGDWYLYKNSRRRLLGLFKNRKKFYRLIVAIPNKWGFPKWWGSTGVNGLVDEDALTKWLLAGQKRDRRFRDQLEQIRQKHGVGNLFELWDSNYLDWLRQCEYCPTWYFASRIDQKNCGKDCRKKKHSSTPEARAQWAQYMRDYRNDQATKPVK
jgi:hypothetical protein